MCQPSTRQARDELNLHSGGDQHLLVLEAIPGADLHLICSFVSVTFMGYFLGGVSQGNEMFCKQLLVNLCLIQPMA